MEFEDELLCFDEVAIDISTKALVVIRATAYSNPLTGKPNAGSKKGPAPAKDKPGECMDSSTTPNPEEQANDLSDA